jgi:hypothetical protein
MVEYDMRVSKAPLPVPMFDTRLKSLTRLRSDEDKKHGWKILMDMWSKGGCPSVSFILTCFVFGL